jgi:hypothetical protein
MQRGVQRTPQPCALINQIGDRKKLCVRCWIGHRRDRRARKQRTDVRGASAWVRIVKAITDLERKESGRGNLVRARYDPVNRGSSVTSHDANLRRRESKRKPSKLPRPAPNPGVAPDQFFGANVGGISEIIRPIETGYTCWVLCNQKLPTKGPMNRARLLLFVSALSAGATFGAENAWAPLVRVKCPPDCGGVIPPNPYNHFLFDTEAAAKAHCKSDALVWVDTKQKAYRLAGSKEYGKEKGEGYMCRKEADAESFHRN